MASVAIVDQGGIVRGTPIPYWPYIRILADLCIFVAGCRLTYLAPNALWVLLGGLLVFIGFMFTVFHLAGVFI